MGITLLLLTYLGGLIWYGRTGPTSRSCALERLELERRKLELLEQKLDRQKEERERKWWWQ
jgi:hypothetical protein